MSGGTVAIIADQAGRYSLFTQSLTGLFSSLPYGTVVDWEIGADQGRSRNILVHRALQRDSEWVLFLDDDHTFPPTLLDVLLSRNVTVVASLYLQRTDPFLPIAYAEKDEAGAYWPLDMTSCPEHGLVAVIGAGAGGMLIKTEVFRKIGDPWFKHTSDQSEDLYFCDKVVAAGIPIYIDLDARLGHVMPISIYPDYEDGQWAAGMATSPMMKVLLPINAPMEDQDAEYIESPILPDQDPGPSPETTALEPQVTTTINGDSAGGNNVVEGYVATRIEMYPDAEGRWHTRGVTEEGIVVEHQEGVFNENDAIALAQARWPGLDIYYVADVNGDSTFVETNTQRSGIGQPGTSSRRSLNRIYGNR